MTLKIYYFKSYYTLKIYLQIRDSAAVVEFASFLEEEVKSGRREWTEISAEQKLNQVRRYNQCATFIFLESVHITQKHFNFELMKVVTFKE